MKKGIGLICWLIFLCLSQAFSQFAPKPSQEKISRALQAAQETLSENSEYKGFEVSELIPLYGGLGVRISFQYTAAPARPYAEPWQVRLPDGQVSTLETVTGNFLVKIKASNGVSKAVFMYPSYPKRNIQMLALPDFKIWQSEAAEIARKTASEEGLEAGEILFVRRIFEKAPGPPQREIRMFWESPLVKSDKIVGTVEIDPWTGNAQIRYFPISCPTNSKLTLEQAKQAALEYFKEMEAGKTHPDFRIATEGAAAAGLIPGSDIYVIPIISDISASQPEVNITQEETPRSKFYLWISAWGELLGYVEIDPFHPCIEEGLGRSTGPKHENIATGQTNTQERQTKPPATKNKPIAFVKKALIGVALLILIFFLALASRGLHLRFILRWKS